MKNLGLLGKIIAAECPNIFLQIKDAISGSFQTLKGQYLVNDIRKYSNSGHFFDVFL